MNGPLDICWCVLLYGECVSASCLVLVVVHLTRSICMLIRVSVVKHSLWLKQVVFRKSIDEVHCESVERQHEESV